MGIVLGSGSVHIDGKPIDGIIDLEYFGTFDNTENTDVPIIKIPQNREITLTAHVDRNTLLSFIHGRKITNNWLKIHGGVMSRKGAIYGKRCIRYYQR